MQVSISARDTDFQGIQFGLMITLYCECVGLHGVMMLCGHGSIILATSSGTGKTTRSHLLEQNSDAVTINGDLLC